MTFGIDRTFSLVHTGFLAQLQGRTLKSGLIDP